MPSVYYTISTDVTSGSVDVSTLRQEIIDDPVVPDSNYIIIRGGLSQDDLEINFSAVLNSSEKTALDSVVELHPQIIENSDSGTSSFAYDRPPDQYDDSSKGIQTGDIWIDKAVDVYVCRSNIKDSSKWSLMPGAYESSELRGLICLGSILNYSFAASNSGTGDIQYTRIWLTGGEEIAHMVSFIDSNGSSTRFIRAGIYDQEDPLDDHGVPRNRVAQTNATPTGPGLDNTYIESNITTAGTGGTGADTTYVVGKTGWHWAAFIADNTSVKYITTNVHRADFLPVRRESGTGTVLPATASNLSNPASAVIFNCIAKTGAV